MKKNAIALSAIAMMALAPSCSLKEELVPEDELKVEISISASSDDVSKTGISRSGSFYWTSGDALKVFETAKSPDSFNIYDSAPGATSDGGQTMTFGVSVDKKSASSFGYTAFYPKTSLYSNPVSASAVAINIPSTQSPDALTFDKNADVLIAKPVEYPSTQPTTLCMRFARPVAVGCVTLTGLPGTPSSITFSAEKNGNPVSVAGATTFNLNTAEPTGAYGDAAAATDLVIDCTGIDYTLLGSATPYIVSDFDWNSQTVGAGTSGPSLKGNGVFFTCWPFTLGENDSFKIVARVGEYLYTKNVVVPNGRTFTMPEGGLGTFSVDMSAVTPVYSPDDYYSRWERGEDIIIGGRTYNKATFGSGTLIADGGSLPARTGVYFIDTDASVTMGGSYSYTDGDLIVIGRTPGNRPTLTKDSKPSYYNGADDYIAFKNVNFVANSVPAFNLDSKYSAIDFEDCTMAIGLLYSSASDDTGADNLCVKNCKIALCKEDVQDGNRDNGITRGMKNTSMTKFEFCDNLVYPLHGVPSRFGFNQDLSKSLSNTADEVVFKNNLFVDVAPYKTFANWSNDYKLTVTGNIIDFNGIRTDANSISADTAELCYFAQRPDGSALSDVTEGGNAVYFTNPAHFSYAVVRQPLSENNKYQVGVPQETVLASRDFVNGEFPLKSGALYAEAFTGDGTRFWGSVDCANHKIYIHHVPRADMITSVKIWPESCECSDLSGSWPTKSVTVDDLQYDVILPDYVSGTPLSGYTLQWADEFTLDHVERQAWRNTTSGGGGSDYLVPSDASLETVSDGSLKLWYKTVSSSIGHCPESSSLGYVAGGIDSRYRRGFTFANNCRMEVRMKWNEMAGLWQAAWMLADPNQGFGSSRRCVGGEIDIIEHLATQKTMFQTLHTENTVTNGDPSNCGQARIDKNTHSDTWFTFGVEVTNAGTSSASIKFYIDGTVSEWYKEYSWGGLKLEEDFGKYVPKSYWSGKETGDGYYWPFDLFEYCMILTAQVGGNWCGEPNGTTAIPAGTKAMTVDYVRYFTKN